MRKLKTPYPTINTLLSEIDKVLFNLFYLIAESGTAFWVTDDQSYLIGQTNERLPL